MKITLDRDACVGAGQCILAAPTVFDLDDEGKVIMLIEDLGAELHEQIRNAAFSCPAFAIDVDET